MQVNREVFYHIHRKNIHPEKWKVGNKLYFSKKEFNSFFGYYTKYVIEKNCKTITDDSKIREYTMLIRELVYEEIRRSEFPMLPSRRHCIWLCDEDTLNLWLNTLEGDVSVYKVKVSGNLHMCCGEMLEDNRINYTILTDVARRYWKGENAQTSKEREYLLEGEVEIIEELNVKR